MAGNPFWEFSVSFYGKADVALACIALQDEAGADVNLVLFALWCAATSRRLDAGRIAAANAALASWRAGVVEPLRRVRREMKADLLPPLETASCREKVKTAEIEAERLSQEALFALAPPSGKATDAAAATAATYLELYARHLGRALPDAPIDKLLAAFAAGR